MAKKKQNKLSTEEMAKTQVINLEDVQKLASYEKLISKKPAAVVALIGLLAIITGVSAQVVVSLSANNKTKEAPQTEARIVEEQETGVNYSCSITENQQAYEQTVKFTYSVTYDESTNIINSYEKITEVLPNSTTSTVALKSIESGKNIFKTYQNYSIDGYKVLVENYKTGYKVTVSVDNTKIDATKLNPELANNLYVKYDIGVGVTVQQVAEYLKSLGYTCK